MRNDTDFQQQLAMITRETNRTVMSFLQDANDAAGKPLTVSNAMRYALEGGGKRLRPILMRLAFEHFGGRNQALLAPFQASIEMIHTYSLIHDDLPCMITMICAAAERPYMWFLERIWPCWPGTAC